MKKLSREFKAYALIATLCGVVGVILQIPIDTYLPVELRTAAGYLAGFIVCGAQFLAMDEVEHKKKIRKIQADIDSLIADHQKRAYAANSNFPEKSHAG